MLVPGFARLCSILFHLHYLKDRTSHTPHHQHKKEKNSSKFYVEATPCMPCLKFHSLFIIVSDNVFIRCGRHEFILDGRVVVHSSEIVNI